MQQLFSEMRAGDLRRSQVAGFFSAVLGIPGAPAEDGPYGGFGRAALAGEALIALLVGSLMPSNDAPQNHQLLYLYGAVHPAWRRRGIGRRLLGGVVEDCRATGSRITIYATLTEDEAAGVAPFLLKNGFVEMIATVCYGREIRPGAASDNAFSAAAADSMSTKVYRGGDLALDAAIADIHRRAYRGRLAVPQLTAEKVRQQLKDPNLAYLLLFDGEMLVGLATAYTQDAECYVDSILVSRSHWGSGASDILGRAAIRYGLENECRRITGSVDATNRANRALMERHGLSQTAQLRRFRRSVEN